MPRKRKSLIVSVDRINQVLSFEKLSGVFRWKSIKPKSSVKVGDQAGAVDGSGYIKIKIDGVSYPAHYLAWAVTYGSYPSRTIMQINGDRSDCRPSNLEMKTDHRDGINASTIRQVLEYNPSTGLFIWKCNRSRTAKQRDVAGNIDPSDGYVRIGFNGTLYKAHRLVWLYVFGKWPQHEIDHINGVRHDNRLINLRDINDLGTAQNRGIGKDNTSGRIGVSALKNGKYTAFIRANGNRFHLGTFATFEDACKVRRQKELELFGELARNHDAVDGK